MPIHPDIARRFQLLEGITSFREGFADPDQRAQIQRFQNWVPAVAPPAVGTRSQGVPGPHGPVPVRVYLPPQDTVGDNPAFVWVHGGGFVGGDLDMKEADWTAREVAARAGAVVVSVDYRLAVGEVAYPVPLDDVVAAVRWTRDGAADLGIDPGRICVGGASAGGNLAAGGVLRLRDDEGWQPAILVLVYPMLHAELPPYSPSLAAAMEEVPEVVRMSPADARFLSENYLGGSLSSACGYATPALGALGGLCPTLLINAEYDDLRSSGEAFTAALALAGVEVRQVTARGMLHAFLNLPAEIQPVDEALTLIAHVVASDPPSDLG